MGIQIHKLEPADVSKKKTGHGAGILGFTKPADQCTGSKSAAETKSVNLDSVSKDNEPRGIMKFAFRNEIISAMGASATTTKGQQLKRDNLGILKFAKPVEDIEKPG